MDKRLSIDRSIGAALDDLDKWSDENDGVFFHTPDAELAQPYLREDYLIKQCKNKRVLHFGFADSPFTEKRYGTKEMLHTRIQKVASEVWGADIDKRGTEIYKKLSGDKKFWVMDVCDPNLDINTYSKDFDTILFGEILEHLLNPGSALQNLHKIAKQNDAQLIITTPNAFNAAGFVAAVKGNEIVHPEHYYYYSPVTLKRLLNDCGFSDVKISFYSGSNTKNLPGLTFPGLIAECKV